MIFDEIEYFLRVLKVGYVEVYKCHVFCALGFVFSNWNRSETALNGFSVLTAKWKYSDNKRDSPDSKRSLLMKESCRARVLD